MTRSYFFFFIFVILNNTTLCERQSCDIEKSLVTVNLTLLNKLINLTLLLFD